ncbi:DUF4268 domain-containing protein [Sporosarcina limicola]|uniref:DUF4268 domain-containing protein n=1 Tax=Sporosarcina limicola TaxID=34101 RepID=A0A927MIZ8_9BACL|nr:DUF4268 domain-containing protein [Sporosarcina limicola]MBE1555473.1 hypothetical protein [Sporosarcina limicola]
MFVVDQGLNKITKIANKTFQELGIREREHLQEWIADNTECLGEELLIIQKEFDGFDDTNERLDLLALDKNGDLVIIENKLDDSGRDVTWQALKYVSYCHTLTKPQIKEIYQSYLDKNMTGEDAEENIEEFFNGEPFQEIALNENDQRMILVAGKFRKEVTSTVLWLIDHGIKVQCFKVSPYEFESKILLDIEQIIPVKETQELMIKMTDKKRQVMENKELNHKRYEIRKEFWGQLLEKFNTMSDQYKNVNPNKDHWLSSGSGVSGVPFSFVITRSYAAVEVLINVGGQAENKRIFDALYQSIQDIEKNLGSPLFWQRLDDKKSSRISYRLEDVNYFNRDDWDKIIEFLCKAMINFVRVIKEPLKQAAH